MLAIDKNHRINEQIRIPQVRVIAADGSHAGRTLVAVDSVAEPARFEDVYDQYAEFVWRSARRLGVPDAALEDVVQEGPELEALVNSVRQQARKQLQALVRDLLNGTDDALFEMADRSRSSSSRRASKPGIISRHISMKAGRSLAAITRSAGPPPIAAALTGIPFLRASMVIIPPRERPYRKTLFMSTYASDLARGIRFSTSFTSAPPNSLTSARKVAGPMNLRAARVITTLTPWPCCGPEDADGWWW